MKIQEQLSSLQEQLAEERAAREAEAAEFRADKVALEAKIGAEHMARNALARRVAELAREVAEDRCARADDHARLIEMEVKETPRDGGMRRVPPGLELHTSSVEVSGWPSEPNSATLSTPVPTGLEIGGRGGRGRGGGKNGGRGGGRARSSTFGDDLNGATHEQLNMLAKEILLLCDSSPTGAILCANLPRTIQR